MDASSADLATIFDLSLKYQFNSEIKGPLYLSMIWWVRIRQSRKFLTSSPSWLSSDATILIEGATGTGKDVLAKVIHHAGMRSKRPLVKGELRGLA